MTSEQRAAASELLHLHDFAMKSGSCSVQAFGVLILGRIGPLIRGEVLPLDFTDVELRDAANAAESLEALEA